MVYVAVAYVEIVRFNLRITEIRLKIGIAKKILPHVQNNQG